MIMVVAAAPSDTGVPASYGHYTHFAAYLDDQGRAAPEQTRKLLSRL